MHHPSTQPDGRILIVDDNLENLKLIEQLLDFGGYSRVKSLSRSDLVLETTLKWGPDLILLDLHMPGATGYDVLREFSRALPADTFLPILVCTADQTLQARQTARDLGAIDFITKPFDATELLLRVRNFLKMRSMHLELQQRHAALITTEESVRRLVDELQFANDELQGFTYSVSHDLRSPLRAILSASQILMEDCSSLLDPEHLRLLERQAHNAKRLATIIDELLKLSRVSRVPMSVTKIDLSNLAKDLLSELRDSTDTSATEFVIEPKLVAIGDELLLRLVLANLLENAVKFSPNGGRVTFGRADHLDSMPFYVKDEGIGFDMAHAGRMFEPFERLVGDDEFPGTGIGLANVKRIVVRHGGKVWAESEPGKGCTLYFTLGNLSP